ncbi:hypothetical protein CsSME_00004678 [Camellia sinensis var. sinensis]
MNDWAAPIIATALFAFLSPGLVFQMPGKDRPVDFLNMKTSVVSMILHTVLYVGGFNLRFREPSKCCDVFSVYKESNDKARSEQRELFQ